MKVKRMTATFIAAAAALSMTMTVFAADADEETHEQTRETVNIAGYDCWEENGNYFAVVDGEVCLIVDLTDISMLSNEAAIVSEIVASPNGGEIKKYDIDLSDGREYEGQIDITNGDCTTPVFYLSPDCPYRRLKFRTGFVFPTTYSVTDRADYCGPDGKPLLNWHPYEKTITFSLPAQCYYPIILAYQKGFGILTELEFHKEGSTGEPKFTYWMSPVG